MDNGLNAIAVEAEKLARALPYSLLVSVAESVASSDASDPASTRDRIIQSISHPQYRSLVAGFLDSWESQAEKAAPRAVALALLTAAHSEKSHREDESVELVWTGPDVGVVPCRRTEQAVLQVIDSATERVTVVSYAVYRISHIRDALVAAARRGVRITVIVETPDRVEGQKEYNTLRALGDDVASCAAVYYWPQEKREKDAAGRSGILHVKCAVADGRSLFLSSANLTEYAFTINMELGVLVTGGRLPKQVEDQFDRLIQSEVLRHV